MRRVDRLTTVFLAEIPEVLEDGILYVSRECGVALHNCACGCGEEVSTPMVHTEYTLTMDGDDATIWPSVGNHDFACASHYLIEQGRIIWASRMSRAAIEVGRERDRLLKRPNVRVPLPTRGPSWVRRFGDWLGALRRKLFG